MGRLATARPLAAATVFPARRAILQPMLQVISNS
jgi:hypothetical protein